MDFGTVLYKAQKNDQNVKEKNWYKTSFAPPKKEQREKTLSVNIQKFLAKKDEEEKQKKLEAQRKKEELLALRSKDKTSTKRIQSMLKRTKSANKSVLEDAVDDINTAVTAVGPSQPDEDDYGYVSQEAAALYDKLVDKYAKLPDEPIFSKSSLKSSNDISSTKDRVKAALLKQEEEKLLPRKRKRKSALGDGCTSEHVDCEPDEETTEKNLQHANEKLSSNKAKFKIPKRNQTSQPVLDFQSLLKIAEKKQHEPVVIEKPVDNNERPMTEKEKLEYLRLKQRQRTKCGPTMRKEEEEEEDDEEEEEEENDEKLYKKVKSVAGSGSSSSVSSAIISNSRVAENKSQLLSVEDKLKKSSKVWSIPSSNISPNNRFRANSLQQQQKYSNEVRDVSSKNIRLGTEPETKRISVNSSDRNTKINTSNKNNEKTINHNNYNHNGSGNGKGGGKICVETNGRLRQTNYPSGKQSNRRDNDMKPVSSFSDTVAADRHTYNHEKEGGKRLKMKESSTSTNRGGSMSEQRKPSLSSESSCADSKSVVCKTSMIKDTTSSNAPKVVELKNKMSYAPSSKNVQSINRKYLPNVSPQSKTTLSKDNSKGDLDLPKKGLPLKGTDLMPTDTTVKQSKLNRNYYLENERYNSTKTVSSKASVSNRKMRDESSSDITVSQSSRAPRPFPPPPPSDLQPRRFPPSDIQPRRFPPVDVKRKRHIVESDDEYDSDMDDFIDDSEDPNDYSKYISEIFGYDKSKYRDIGDDDDADECMESNFSELQKEEFISTKYGILEDLADVRRKKAEKEHRLKKMVQTRKRRL